MPQETRWKPILSFNHVEISFLLKNMFWMEIETPSLFLNDWAKIYVLLSIFYSTLSKFASY